VQACTKLISAVEVLLTICPVKHGGASRLQDAVVQVDSMIAPS